MLRYHKQQGDLFMHVLLPSLAKVFNTLAVMCKWGFILVSTLIMYLNGFPFNAENFLLMLALFFAVLVTICELFAMILVRLPNLYSQYAKRIRNALNER